MGTVSTTSALQSIPKSATVLSGHTQKKAKEVISVTVDNDDEKDEPMASDDDG
jgi:hypothetical protein